MKYVVVKNNFMKYDVIKYDIMKYKVMKYDIMKYEFELGLGQGWPTLKSE